MKKLLTALGLLLPLMAIAPKPAAAAIDVVGRCVAVESGDTIVVAFGGTEHYVRLEGVDVAPLDSYDANRSRAYLSDFVLGRDVRLDLASWTPDSDGALLGWVYMGPGVFVNLAMITGGYAVVWDAGLSFIYRDRFYAAEHRAWAAHRAWWATAEHRNWYAQREERAPHRRTWAPEERRGERYNGTPSYRHGGGGGAYHPAAAPHRAPIYTRQAPQGRPAYLHAQPRQTYQHPGNAGWHRGNGQSQNRQGGGGGSRGRQGGNHGDNRDDHGNGRDHDHR